jgi:hypothetical protein
VGHGDTQHRERVSKPENYAENFIGQVLEHEKEPAPSLTKKG